MKHADPRFTVKILWNRQLETYIAEVQEIDVAVTDGTIPGVLRELSIAFANYLDAEDK